MAGRHRPGDIRMMPERPRRIVLTTPHARWEPLHDVAAKLHLASPEASEEHETVFDHSTLKQVSEAAGLRLVRQEEFPASKTHLVLQLWEP